MGVFYALCVITITSLYMFQTALAQDCATGQDFSSGVCYVASRGYTSFYEAYKECTTFGCTIAMPDDQAAADLLSTYASGKGITTDLWLGGVDFASEGTYVRVGTGQNITFTNWYDGEPNGGNGESCILVDSVATMKMRDTNCDTNKRFICLCPTTTNFGNDS